MSCAWRGGIPACDVAPIVDLRRRACMGSQQPGWMQGREYASRVQEGMPRLARQSVIPHDFGTVIDSDQPDLDCAWEIERGNYVLSVTDSCQHDCKQQKAGVFHDVHPPSLLRPSLHSRLFESLPPEG